MNGLGNDFVIIDARTDARIRELTLESTDIRFIANRNNPETEGCDQVLILRPPNPRGTANCYMQIFNSDGSEVGACGNGARAVAACLGEKEQIKQGVIETKGGDLAFQLIPWYERNWIDLAIPSITMPLPKFQWQDIPLSQEISDTSAVTLHKDLPPAFLVNVGNPHAVFFIEDERDIYDLAEQYGPDLEKHELFPERANINFVAKKNKDLQLSTWERGAGLTKSCGTGACAAAIAAYHLKKTTDASTDVSKDVFTIYLLRITRTHEFQIIQDHIVVGYNKKKLAQQGPVEFEDAGELSL